MPSQPAAVDREFVDTVAKDVRGYLDNETQRWLHSDEMVDRRYDGLIALKKDVEVQLATQRARWVKKQVECQANSDDGSAWLAFRASEQDWRVRAVKFLGAVDKNICAVKEIRRNRHNYADIFRAAIQTHKEEIVEGSEVDEDLWATLEA